MTPQEFIAKWEAVTLSERSACQQHFLDLCDLFDHPKPAKADPTGQSFTFERGASKSGGGQGWADVWKKGFFGWEYKGKHKDLAAAYRQLLQYREDLENPPLLVVCDMDRFEVHTNFTGTVKVTHAFNLQSLVGPDKLDILRRTFFDPHSLKPGLSTQKLTEQAAELFGQLADGLRQRGIPAHDAAHFLMKLMFCMFAEDIELLPEKVFSRTLTSCKQDPKRLAKLLGDLFAAMSTGGNFGADEILYFNGGLFSPSPCTQGEGRGEGPSPSPLYSGERAGVRGSPPPLGLPQGSEGLAATDAAPQNPPSPLYSGERAGVRGSSQNDVILLIPAEITKLIELNKYDWSDVEPSIFGTLFERTLDPAKRSQIGAHYTSREDILTLLEPVMMVPLRREWEDVKARCEKIAEEAAKAKTPATRKTKLAQRDRALQDFVERLAHVTVLDPACGSGNFLYVAIHLLLNLEKETIAYAATRGLGLLPHVRPTQLSGLEINPFAQELAQVVIWIGYLQWMQDNGFSPPRNPVLEPIESIKLMDSILDLSDPEHPKEPDWPAAEFIVGNPPFLGDKKLRTGLGDEYINRLFEHWADRIPNQSDLCCYWFEQARDMIARGKAKRVGLLATQGIRGGRNRSVLNSIKKTGDIFFAESDRRWVLDGANVHVSMVGFDNGSERDRRLDGAIVTAINANLTAGADTTRVNRLSANLGIAYIGTTKKASLDIPSRAAAELHVAPNPHGRPNSDVLFPYANGMTITRRPGDDWIIDFAELPMEDAGRYEKPFEYVRSHVYPSRRKHREPRQREKWWLLARSCPEMKDAIRPLRRFLVTPTVCKHRVFAWLTWPTNADHQLYVFAREDDYFFGVLHCRAHEIWALKLGTRLETRPRYTPTTCFETFPFPKPTDKQREAISAAAKELDDLRNNWLNPPEWTREEVLEFPGSTDGPWTRYVVNPDKRGIGTVRYPRRVPIDTDAAIELKKRTLTQLYNKRPTWLDLAHQKLDAAVFTAYGWEPTITDDDLLARLLELNLKRAADQH